MKAGPILWFVCVSVFALVVFRLVDTGLFALLPPGLKVLADIRVPSLLLLLALCLGVPSARPLLGAPRALPGRPVLVMGAVVLAMSFVVPALTGTGLIHLPRLEDRVAFYVLGAFNEELLCRALVLGAALKVFVPASSSSFSSSSSSSLRQPAVIATTIVFSLMHAQHHDFVFGPALNAQLLWTIPLGLALSALAFETRSLWPSVVVHIANNALVGLAAWVRATG